MTGGERIGQAVFTVLWAFCAFVWYDILLREQRDRREPAA